MIDHRTHTHDNSVADRHACRKARSRAAEEAALAVYELQRDDALVIDWVLTSPTTYLVQISPDDVMGYVDCRLTVSITVTGDDHTDLTVRAQWFDRAGRSHWLDHRSRYVCPCCEFHPPSHPQPSRGESPFQVVAETTVAIKED